MQRRDDRGTPRSGLEALPDWWRAAIHGEEFGAGAMGFRDHERTGRNKRLFVGQGDVAAEFDRPQGLRETSTADDRRQHEIAIDLPHQALGGIVTGEGTLGSPARRALKASACTPRREACCERACRPCQRQGPTTWKPAAMTPWLCRVLR